MKNCQVTYIETKELAKVQESQPEDVLDTSLLGVCFVAEGPVRRNTFGRSAWK
jgi:hypothetical protein